MGRSPPARRGAVGHACVDQQHRNLARGGLQYEVGPEFGFYPDREVRPPVPGEAPDRVRPVHRHELVAHTLRQALAQQPRRGDGAGRDQDTDVGDRFAQPGDQRQQGQALAHTYRVHPDQPALGPGQAGPPEPFAEPGTVFLAPAPAMSEPGIDHRRGQHAGAAIAARRDQGFDHRCAAAAAARARPSPPRAALAAGSIGSTPTMRSAWAVSALSRSSRVRRASSSAALSASDGT